MKQEAKLIFGYLFLGVMLPAIIGVTLVSTLRPFPLASGVGLAVAGGWFTAAGLGAQKKARALWGVRVRDAFRLDPARRPEMYQARFLVVAATLSGMGIVMVGLGCWKIIG
ncbi:MAG: hypothetical protein ACE5GO_02685 [Anaerolineales bacterium]